MRGSSALLQHIPTQHFFPRHYATVTVIKKPCAMHRKGWRDKGVLAGHGRRINILFCGLTMLPLTFAAGCWARQKRGAQGEGRPNPTDPFLGQPARCVVLSAVIGYRCLQLPCNHSCALAISRLSSASWPTGIARHAWVSRAYT